MAKKPFTNGWEGLQPNIPDKPFRRPHSERRHLLKRGASFLMHSSNLSLAARVKRGQSREFSLETLFKCLAYIHCSTEQCIFDKEWFQWRLSTVLFYFPPLSPNFGLSEPNLSLEDKTTKQTTTSNLCQCNCRVLWLCHKTPSSECQWN